MNPPAFQFYPDDFVAGVSTMTQEEVGAYILLLCHQWSVGKLSEDVSRMKIVAKGEVSEHVLSKFPGGKNKRLEFERKKQRVFRESRAKNGKLGGRPRKASDNLVVSGIEPRKSSPSPSPSPSPEEEREGALAHFPEVEAPSDPYKLPPSINSPAIQDAWRKWLEHLKQLRRTPTIISAEAQIKALESMGPERALKAILHSITANWQSIHEPDHKSKNGIKPNPRNFGTGVDAAAQGREIVEHLKRIAASETPT